jgi:DNA-binding transcriptional LysR family regulator
MLGAALFYRSTHRVALSEAGRALYEQAATHIQALGRISGVPEHGTGLTGELRIAAPHDVCVVLLPEILARFSRRHPRVAVDIRVSNMPLDLVREGLDAAIRGSLRMPEDSSLSVRRIVAGPRCLYASPTYVARFGEPSAIGDPAHDWIAFGGDAMPSDGKAPRFRTDDFLLARELVRGGLGVGALPQFLAEPLIRAGELVEVTPSLARPSQGGGLFLIFPSKHRLSRKLTAFRDVLLEYLAATTAGAQTDQAAERAPT